MSHAEHPPERARSIILSPLGRHTRFMLAMYLRNTANVFLVLLSIALTIDLLPQLHLVTMGTENEATVWRVMRFLVLRAPDIAPPLLPLSTFLGVLWSEVSHTASGERLLIWNSGRSPIQCLAPIAILGVLLGVAQFVTDAYLRPAAIGVQIAERLGADGIRLDRTRAADNQWLVSPDGLVRADISYGPPPTLRNIAIFKLDGNGHLSEVYRAKQARPLGDGARWLLSDGRFWRAGHEAAAKNTLVVGALRQESETPFAQRVVPLALDPLWLSNMGMSPQYLSLDTLRGLAGAEPGVQQSGRFRTRLWTLYGELLLPGAMALLANMLAMLFFAYRIPPRALVFALLAGYLAHFATKAFLLMGEDDYVAPLIAGWVVPVTLLLLALAIFRTRVTRGGRYWKSLLSADM